MEVSIRFNYSVNEIKKIQKDFINNEKNWINNIKNNKNITPYEFLQSYIYKNNKFDYILNTIIFLKYVSNNKNIRNACNNLELEVKKYNLNFYKSSTNYKLFLILKKIKIENNDKNNLKKLIKKILKEFEDNGVNLKKNNKNKLTKINNKLNNYENLFSQNIYNSIINLKFNKKDLEGINKNILLQHKTAKNKYIFNTTYPDKNVILKNCKIENTRKKIYITFNSVAKENLKILNNILNLRYKRSKILGFKNSVDYYFSQNRIQNENKLNNLLNKLLPILKKKSKNEYNNLISSNNVEKNIVDYDIIYYSNLYKKNILNYNNNKIKEYFPSNYTINKIMDIYAEIFGISINLIKGNSSQYWNNDVELYKICDIQTLKTLGYLYLDIYPRNGKYTHAATFDLQNAYFDNNNNRIIPVSAIVCNFEKNNNGVSLFSFNEILTFCHEFGHGLHFILSNVKYEFLSGISMEEDFAEMPSQFFENWCYESDFLKKISLHYKDKTKINDELINKIITNKNYLNGMHFLTQISLIKYDINVHKQKKVNKKFLYNLWFKLHNELLPYKITNNIYPMCRFDHIIEYSVGYYGYLTSLIYSYDAFSLFKKEGIFSKKLGMNFRKKILEMGGTINGMIMLEDFLERKHENIHFFKIFE